MGRADKKSEKLATGMEELERELQATRAQLKEREREAAAEASEAWKHEKNELIRELDLTKTKFARTQRVERTKFLEFYRIIQELRDENEKVKAQGGGGGSGGGSEAQRRLADENEKQAKRIREQRDFIEELMQSKSKLMDQVSSAVKRNASLARENAVLQDTIRQQLSLIENHSTHSDHHHHHHDHTPQPTQTPTRPDSPRPAVATPSHAPTTTTPSTPPSSTAAPASSTAPRANYTQSPSPLPQLPRPQVASPQQPRVQAPVPDGNHHSPSVRRDLFGAPPGRSQDAMSNGLPSVSTTSQGGPQPAQGGWLSFGGMTKEPFKPSAEFML
jgi:hypothetical protein